MDKKNVKKIFKIKTKIKKFIIYYLDENAREANDRRLEIRRQKQEYWINKQDVRKDEGRKKSRKKNGIKIKNIRNKYESLERYQKRDFLFDENDFSLHNGEHNLGLWQLETLKKMGLKPDQDFLDIGCGDLKGGVPLVRFLDSSRYVGVEQNSYVVDQGVSNLAEKDVLKSPEFFIGGDFSFEKIGRKFDFAWAHSVFSHVDLSLCGKCLASVYDVLKQDGVFAFTYFAAEGLRSDWTEDKLYRQGIDISEKFRSDKFTYSFKNPFHHSDRMMLELVKSIGYKAPEKYGYSPKGQTILVVRRGI